MNELYSPDSTVGPVASMRWSLREIVSRVVTDQFGHTEIESTNEWWATSGEHRVVFTGPFARSLAEAFMQMMTSSVASTLEPTTVPSEALAEARRRALMRAYDPYQHSQETAAQHAEHAADTDIAYRPVLVDFHPADLVRR